MSRRTKKLPGRPKMPERPAWYCHRCGLTFTAWAPAQRHSNANRGHRIELAIPQ